MTGLRASLTKTGRAALVGSVGLLFGAGTSGQVLAAAAGALLLGLVAGALLATRRAGPALDHLLLELHVPDAPAPRRGQPVRLDLVVTNTSERDLRDVRLRVAGSGEPQPAPAASFDAPARARGRVPLTFSLERAGHWRTHGAELQLLGPLGMAVAERYVPLERPIHVQPARLAPGLLRRVLAPVGAVRDREGRHLSHENGSGLELRELRDYVPGDPLKSLAWKATARRRKPLVRVFEEETVRRVQLLVDAGPTMRGGDPGASPLDHAIDLAAAVADLGLEDRLGVTTFDLRVFGHLRAGTGREHVQRVLQHLLDLSRVVDEDLTEITDAELLALVGRFLERQHGLRLRANEADPDRMRSARDLSDPLWELYDSGAVFAIVTAYLAEDRDRGHAVLHAKARPAKDLLAARLRLFCALRGIALPYRLTGPLDARERGLVAAVSRNLGGGAAETLLVLTDLRGLAPDGPGVRALRLAVAHKRRVIVVRLGDVPPADAVVETLRAARVLVVDGRRLRPASAS